MRADRPAKESGAERPDKLGSNPKSVGVLDVSKLVVGAAVVIGSVMTITVSFG